MFSFCQSNHMTCQQCSHQWCWLCLGDYAGGHFGTGPCEGLQFAAFDTLEEATESTREERERQEREEREREAFAQTPEGRRAAEQSRKRIKSRRRKRRLKKAAVYTAVAPLVVVGGVAVLGLAIVASPFLLLGSLS